MDRLPADIRSHLLTESIADPRRMATRADELWTVRGRVNTVQSLSSQNFEDISRKPKTRSSSSRVRTNSPGPSTSSSSSSECWFHRKWGNQANQCRSSCSYSGNKLTARMLLTQFPLGLRPHLRCSSRTGLVPPSFSWIPELLYQCSLTCPVLLQLQVHGSN